MALRDLPVNSISEADLQRLIDDGVGEGPNLEYKRATYGGSDQDHFEFLADISAFANTDGGDLILGVEETDGRPSKLCGVQGNADVELLRLESIALAGLQPRIPALRMRFVPLASGGNALLIRVPSSRIGPHRVTYRGRNRFWARQGGRKYEPDVGELRLLFNGSTDAFLRAKPKLTQNQAARSVAEWLARALRRTSATGSSGPVRNAAITRSPRRFCRFSLIGGSTTRRCQQG